MRRCNCRSQRSTQLLCGPHRHRRIRRGTLRAGRNVVLRYGEEDRGSAKIAQVLTFTGLQRTSVEEAAAGDIVAITGIEDVNIAHHLRSAAAGRPAAHPGGRADAGDDLPGEHLAAGWARRQVRHQPQIRDRLYRELQSNVALRARTPPDADAFRVLGRGELHLTILIENMRREGYELAVGKPQVLKKMSTARCFEPFER